MTTERLVPWVDGRGSADDLVFTPAVEILAMFRARELSPVEYMEAVVARAVAAEPSVGALADTFFPEAIQAARSAEERYMGRGRRPRALEGLPVAIKDAMDVAGQRNTRGSLINRDAPPAETTAPLAQRVLDAGAIVHARTRTPEFSCVPFTHSRLWGVTRNPWNPDYDVGGSSGGSGAAIAAGMTPLASGSDIGGSIRIPASCCGVVGYKPPYGRVAQSPPLNLDHYCHNGPMARTVDDCALMQNVIVGPHPSDVAAIREPLRIPSTTREIHGWRIALSPDLGDYAVHPDMVRNLYACADALRAAGAVVEEVRLPWRQATIEEAARIHFATIFGPAIQGVMAEHRDEMTDYAIRFAEETIADASRGTFLHGLSLEAEIYAGLSTILEDYRVLLCPTLALPALEAGASCVDRWPRLDGAELTFYKHLLTIPFNICSRCPVLSVPSGFAGTGVPTGIQIVGRVFDDVSVFRVGHALERERPWTAERPVLPAPTAS